MLFVIRRIRRISRVLIEGREQMRSIIKAETQAIEDALALRRHIAELEGLIEYN